MFGLTLNKIIFTVLVIVAVWRGFRWLEQARARSNMAVQSRRQRQERRPRWARRNEAGSAAQERPRAKPAVDLVACPRCGAYVPNGTICPDIENCVMKNGGDKRSHAA